MDDSVRHHLLSGPPINGHHPGDLGHLDARGSVDSDICRSFALRGRSVHYEI